jgi:hypothetical protein
MVDAEEAGGLDLSHSRACKRAREGADDNGGYGEGVAVKRYWRCRPRVVIGLASRLRALRGRLVSRVVLFSTLYKILCYGLVVLCHDS